MSSETSRESRAAADALQSEPLQHLLTIVLVTSPIRSHPSTEMLERTLVSYVENSADLAECAKIVVSDGFTIAGPEQKPKPKSGRIPEAWVLPYSEFRDRLDGLVVVATTSSRDDAVGMDGGLHSHPATRKRVVSAFRHCWHLRMEQHKGFGGCTYCALRLVKTPYVLVLQHDRPCTRAFPASRLLGAMLASKGMVKYVGLPTKASLARTLPAAVQSRCQFRLDDDAVDEGVAAAAAMSEVTLRVLLFWYDSSHLCQVSHYRDVVFAKGHVPGGGFPEDSFGQAMHADICAGAQAGRWRQAHAAYGTYLYVDGQGPLVGHLRGRRYSLDAAERGKLRMPSRESGLKS